MPAFQTEGNYGGDVVIHVESQEYCMTSAVISNQTGQPDATIEYVAGYPLIDDGYGGFSLAVQGDEANVVAIIVQGKKIDALADGESTAEEYLVLQYPPCCINKDRLPADDFNGDAFDVDAIEDALKTLKWQVRTEPTKQSTQTE